MKNKIDKSSRGYNLVMNSLFGIVAALIQVILNYAVRFVIIKELGAEINGIHNLFQSIINVMALMESCFGTALIVHLYKPIEENDEERIKEIISFYKKIYFAIAGIFLGVCVFIDIFVIESLITSSIELPIVRFYFMLFALSFVVNYATYYKRGILFAEQKNRVSIGVTLLCELIFRVASILIIVKYHYYTIVLVLIILEKLVTNIICNIYINKEYPCVKKLKNIPIDKSIKKSVFNVVKPLLVYNIAHTLQQSAKSIYSSYFLGNVSVVGYIGNYQLVISSVLMLCSHFGGAFTSAFGNAVAQDDKEYMYSFYKRFNKFILAVTILMSSGIICCIQDFILLAFGKEYILGIDIVIVLIIDMFVNLMNVPIISIQNAMGLHYLDKKYMIIQAVIALILGALGGKYFGMMGILLGLLIPLIIFTLINKGVLVFANVFNKKPTEFIMELTKNCLFAILVVFVSYKLCNLVEMNNYLYNILVKGIIAVGINGVFLLPMLFKDKIVSKLKK